MQSNLALRPELSPGTAEQRFYPDLTVIIPTLNEATSIGKLLECISESYPLCQIIVADDASTDQTPGIVRAFAIKRPNDCTIELLPRRDALIRGICASVLDALKLCRTRYFVVIDADLQHPPEKIGELLTFLRTGSRLAIATRRSFSEKQSFLRGSLTALATLVAQVYLSRMKLSVSDPMSGFFGADTEYVKAMVARSQNRFEPEGYKILFDILKIMGGTERIDIVSYDFAERPSGASKMEIRHIFYFFRSLFR